MPIPTISLDEASLTLATHVALFPADTFLLRLIDGIGGWRIEVRAPAGPDLDRSCRRMGLTRRDARDRIEGEESLAYHDGRIDRTHITIVSVTHIITRVSGRL